MKKIILIVASILLAGPFALAEKSKCSKALSEVGADLPAGYRGTVKILPSGRDLDVIPQYKAFAAELSDKGGVLDRLGLPRADQVIQFMQGTDLNASLAGTASGLPVAHYLDGNAVLKAQQSNRLVYEVVWPSAELQHGLYRDDNNIDQQRSIILHVVGHNTFALKSKYTQYRKKPAMQVALNIDSELKAAYKNHDHDEVARWYTFLQTLRPLEDYLSGYDQEVSDFKPMPIDKTEAYSRNLKLGKTKTFQQSSFSPTQNVAKAFVGNLAPDVATWKQSLSKAWSDSLGIGPSLVHTQIMNEGWASFMQELLIKHMPDHHNFSHWVQAQQVMREVNKVQLEDPYWLGVEMWRIIYSDFIKTPEALALDNAEAKDKAFIQYAINNIISKMDDEVFLDKYMPDQWIYERKLSIIQKIPHEKWDPNLPPPQDPRLQNPHQYEVVTKDPKRVKQSIIKNVLHSKFLMRPQIELKSMSRQGTGEVELTVVGQMGKSVAMDEKTLAPSLYVMTQLSQKSVSLECKLKVQDMALEKSPFPEFGMPTPPWWQPRPIVVDKVIDARVVVAPNGEVEVFEITSNEQGKKVEKLMSEKVKVFEQVLDSYVADLYLEDREGFDHAVMNNPRLNEIAVQMAKSVSNSGNITTLNVAVPTAAQAVTEFENMYQKRILRSMELVFQGKGKILKQNGKMYLKALPSVPTLGFDFQHMQSLADEAEPAPYSAVSAMKTVLFKNRFALPDSFLSKINETLGFVESDKEITKEDLNSLATELKSLEIPDTVKNSVFEGLTTYLEAMAQFANSDKTEKIADYSTIVLPKFDDTFATRNPFDGDSAGEGSVKPIGGNKGDKFWGPGKGKGNGKGPGEPGDKPGQPGEEPGPGDPGDVGQDPSWVPIPEDLYADFLAERVTLPNLNPKPGSSNNNKKRLRGVARRQAGQTVMPAIMKKVLEKGLGAVAAEGKDPAENIDEATELGLMYLDRQSDWRVRATKPKPSPDVNAVVTFSMDASGSTIPYYDKFKKMVYDIKTLLEKNYASVEFRFIVFDTQAYVLKNEQEFFKSKLGGGTTYSEGIKATHELFKAEYPRAEWDRFSVFLGDLEDGAVQEAGDAWQELENDSEYVGVIHAGRSGGSWAELDNLAKGRSSESDYFGYTTIGEGQHTINHLKELFKNETDQ